MEFVGRTLSKNFKGFGVFSGTVKSYDSSSGLFKVVYDDGDSEELELHEITSLLDEYANSDIPEFISEKLVKTPSRVGRKPTKRRRVNLGSDSSCGSGALENSSSYSIMSSDYGLGKTLENESREGEDRKAAAIFNGNADLNFHLDVGFNGKGVIDLNKGFSLDEDAVLNGDVSNLNRVLDLNCEIDLNENGNIQKDDIIDLNIDVNEEDENSKEVELKVCADGQKRKGGFDLNLGLDDEIRSLDADCDALVKDVPCCQMDDRTEKRESKGARNGVVENSLACGSQMEDVVFSGNSYKSTESGLLGVDSLNSDVTNQIQLNSRSMVGSPSVHRDQNNLASTSKVKPGRKRRKLSGSTDPVTETALRRSTRRGRAVFSVQDHDISTVGSTAFNEISSSSPAISAVSEEIPTPLASEKDSSLFGGEDSRDRFVLPPKLHLPPSSGNLNFEGIHVLEFFSVYSFLRSFSTLLFLSPFEIGGFVEAVKCGAPNVLFDSIHYSLLQILRKHLESLPDESAPPLSNRYRDLNWDFLDLITWPIFMVEYLLMQGFRLNSVIDLSRLKLFECDYYKQPATVKITILQWLCDDVIESEIMRVELNRRTLVTEPNMNFDQSTKFDSSRKRRTVMDASGGSCLTDEEVDEINDWNSDECCLCKMDGNLICCDGCPAAFHTRCVGVASSLLPEGDWYCPECLKDKEKPWMKLGRSLRGARLLGVDPYERSYYISCGYLLVLDACNTDLSFNYYHINDLPALVEVLKSSETQYGAILSAIFKYWNVLAQVNGGKSTSEPQNVAVYSNFLKNGKMHYNPKLQELVLPHVDPMNDKSVSEGKSEGKLMSGSCSGDMGFEDSELVNVELANTNCSVKMEIASMSSEGSNEVSQAAIGIQNSRKSVLDGSIEFDRKASNADAPEKTLVSGDSSLTFEEVKIQASDCSGIPLTVNTSYVNYYGFARTASLVAEELASKSSVKNIKEASLSVEEIISAQLKAISNKSTDFFWPNVLGYGIGARKEKCGWCFSCKYPDGERGCLFIMNDTSPPLESSMSEVGGLYSNENRKGHLIDVIYYILCIEDRLSGLLSGPWLNPHYSKLWRRNVSGVSDVASLKQLLLMLESNLHRLAFSVDWPRHTESLTSLGSASHVMIKSSRICSRNVVGRKRSKYSDLEPNPSSNAASGLGLFWWRGGRLSRHLFHWKVLPRSMALKAARQGGCKKISGILYPDGSEMAKRSKYFTWRAAVEASQSVEQLALLVREFDANIKWDDIENTYLLLKMDKESTKSVRSFRKAIIRRKCSENSTVKYLLDFGKRRFIPDVVMKHGTMLAESSSVRKRYWLEESHVPLYLLKGFEEKRIARKSNKISHDKLSESKKALRNPSKSCGFSYLFSRAERPAYHYCGHCNKDVLIREAVSCQYCEGFFHKRHVKKSSGTVTANCLYTCHKCQSGQKYYSEKDELMSQMNKKPSRVGRLMGKKNSKKVGKGKKVRSQKNGKNPIVIPLRRSTRKVKCVSIQSTNTRGRKKKGRKANAKKRTEKKKVCLTKKRTQMCSKYWLNGLRFSQKQHDERVMHFRDKKLLILSEGLNSSLGRPKCSLCLEPEFTSTLIYICCEICGEWFHGDAFGLRADNAHNLIGFRCHKCLCRSPPICSQLHVVNITETQACMLKDAPNSEHEKGAPNVLELANEVCVNSYIDEGSKKMILSDEQNELRLDTISSLSMTVRSDKDNGLSYFGLEQETDAIQHSEV